MNQPNENHVKTITDEKEKSLTISDTFQLIYSSSLLIGIILSFFYYYHIGFWPSISNSSAISYIIGIFSVGLLMALTLTTLFIIPSLLFMINDPSKQQRKSYIFGSLPISWLVIILWILIDSNGYHIHSFYIFGLYILLALTKDCFSTEEYKTNLIIDFILPIILFFPLLFIKTFDSYIINTDQLLYITIGLALISFSTNLFYSFGFDNKHSINKQVFVGISIITSATIMFSFIPAMLNAPNPLVFRPFQMLKMGSYIGYLQFTTDFNASTLYKFNGMEFKILSSIGDEYIVKTDDDNNTNIYRINKKYILQETIIDSNSTKEAKK
ncbi:MAG TPA: hypothetical protein CFH83_03625 [Sulfuricurvum kujiense]|uniref:Uncharacterized protein n=2 Tax=Sulfurimonadaceae TaxID=2771471 RepID=A0A2D3WNS5_9BACT|nr:MAG: hypothetical protein A2517_06410 [Sulfuricurvum sp. RIFOXYD12_FULL_44_77]DAB38899.1 MAG TPA: hypothetical protein CFH83_03625 [Sulfuricurvum kujiense]